MRNYHFEEVMQTAVADMQSLLKVLGLEPTEGALVLGGFDAKPKIGKLGGLYREGNLAAFYAQFPYDALKVKRIKQLHYDRDCKPAWQGVQERWRCELKLLPYIAFAFPELEPSGKLLQQFSWIESLQREGDKALSQLPTWWEKHGLNLTGTAPVYEKEGPQELRAIVKQLGLMGEFLG